MWIDIQVAAHLRHQVATDFFLPILEGGEFFAEVQAPVAALAFIAHKFAGDLPAPRQPLYAPLEFRTLHRFSFGHICPNVKPKRASQATTVRGSAGPCGRAGFRNRSPSMREEVCDCRPEVAELPSP
jgi:hypothetical protein